MIDLETMLGAHPTKDGTQFAVFSSTAEKIELCLFDQVSDREIARLPMEREADHIYRLFVDHLSDGAHYGYRAYGPYAPAQALWFDPTKLLLDPYATEVSSAFRHHADLLTFGKETAHLVPKSILRSHHPAVPREVSFNKAGFIYEVCVKSFTMLHPDVPQEQRGTIAALAHPSIISHLKRIGVDAIELMPITAWIDERHLAALNLSNSWGYNPVGMMCIDPRLAPRGVNELRETVDALHDAGISVILDLVFNHSGESDVHGSTLSMRGLDNPTSYRHAKDNAGQLINDTGTGNTIACDYPIVRQLIIDSLRHFVLNAGVDGFRFDLGTILGRDDNGFDRQSETLKAIASDPVLKDRILIAEPWDIGPGGYQLGNFPPEFLEWNDRARDDIRRFWRGDHGMTGKLADAICGSEKIFSAHYQRATRSVNFIAAHDGLTLYDLTAYRHKNNEANGEDNRDGHNDNHSWNNGAEGKTKDAAINAARKQDVKALLSTLFMSRGAIMLTAGDEGGRTQHGNNNAYCQDNKDYWLDWQTFDRELIDHTAAISKLRKRFSVFAERHFFTDQDVFWYRLDGQPMEIGDWERQEPQGFVIILKTFDQQFATDSELAIAFNPLQHDVPLHLHQGDWKNLLCDEDGSQHMPARTVTFYQRVTIKGP
jgi:glycogen operon protein